MIHEATIEDIIPRRGESGRSYYSFRLRIGFSKIAFAYIGHEIPMRKLFLCLDICPIIDLLDLDFLQANMIGRTVGVELVPETYNGTISERVVFHNLNETYYSIVLNNDAHR